jgi:hypothetical protein
VTEGPYRGGRVHVLAEQCGTCIFRAGNPMRLEPGRVKGMVDAAIRDDAAIVCHSTLYRDDVQPAVCRGFYDRYQTQPLQVATRLELIAEDPVPPKEPT